MQTMGGWRCDALLIPDIKFEALYHDGRKADDKDFTIEDHIIRWSRGPKPTDLSVTLSLTKDVPKIEEEKLLLEKEKFNFDQKKTALENRWKFISAIGAVLSGLLTFGATHVLTQTTPQKAVLAPPRVHTDTKELSISEDKCMQSVEKKLENYGLKDITLVRGGVYALQGSYNIFVACEADAKVAFIVVSGPQDSKAKQIRENIKQLIP